MSDELPEKPVMRWAAVWTRAEALRVGDWVLARSDDEDLWAQIMSIEPATKPDRLRLQLAPTPTTSRLRSICISRLRTPRSCGGCLANCPRRDDHDGRTDRCADQVCRSEGRAMSVLPTAYEQFIREVAPALTTAGARWAAVIVVGYADDDVRSLDEAADLTTDEAAGIDKTAASWLVVDTMTGDSRMGGRPQRLAALQALRRHYKPDAGLGHDAPDWDGERTILVSQNMTSEHKAFRLVEATSADLAYRLAGEDVLEGWLPVGIFDLDLRRMIELHIATPVVTPAEDQGLATNPLDA